MLDRWSPTKDSVKYDAPFGGASQYARTCEAIVEEYRRSRISKPLRRGLSLRELSRFMRVPMSGTVHSQISSNGSIDESIDDLRRSELLNPNLEIEGPRIVSGKELRKTGLLHQPSPLQRLDQTPLSI